MTDIVIRWSKEAPVTEEVENICIQAGKRAGVHFDVCIPKTFMVYGLYGGTNYLVKVKVSADKFLHVMIHHPSGTRVPEENYITGVQYPKLISDPLEPKHFKLHAENSLSDIKDTQ